ncbi:MAG: hypothetical protein OEV91_00475 [Desulfobulbaceae bacterium]|nr:hypothetical protein [Desulfobulbaceae bacterium]
MPQRLPPLLFIGLIGTLVTGSIFFMQYGRATWGDQNIWWTPRPLAVSLADTRQEFELLINDELLQKHIQHQTLMVMDVNGGSYPVTKEDIRVRLNNWYKVKASLLNAAVLTAFLLGVSVTCLILGAIPMGGSKENPPPTE